MDYTDIIQVCGNCKHFKIIKQGKEIKKIVDTSYLVSECKVKGWKTKEYYLSEPLKEVTNNDIRNCEFWEYWKNKRGRKNKRGEL